MCLRSKVLLISKTFDFYLVVENDIFYIYSLVLKSSTFFAEAIYMIYQNMILGVMLMCNQVSEFFYYWDQCAKNDILFAKKIWFLELILQFKQSYFGV